MSYFQMVPAWVKMAAAGGVLLALAGCGGGPAGGGLAGGNALNGSSEVVALYKANCVSCHGSELQGRVGPNTNLQKVGARMSVTDIIQQIEQGEGSMPDFKDRLTEDEIAGLAEWLAGKK